MKAAVIQISSSLSTEENLNKCTDLLEQASSQKADLAVLPELFFFMGSQKQNELTYKNSEKALLWAENISRRLKLFLAAGSVLIRNGDRSFNRSYLFSPSGKVLIHYDKIHLFDCGIPQAEFRESDDIAAGEKIAAASLTGEWKAGLGICYDLRFPEQFQALSSLGANILIIPAAFTAKTGLLHWEVLLRARAIENQCYVLASNQCASPCGGLKRYGHSMIISPDGTVMKELEDREGICTADLDFSLLTKIRTEFPTLQHRKKIEIPAAGIQKK